MNDRQLLVQAALDPQGGRGLTTPQGPSMGGDALSPPRPQDCGTDGRSTVGRRQFDIAVNDIVRFEKLSEKSFIRRQTLIHFAARKWRGR